MASLVTEKESAEAQAKIAVPGKGDVAPEGIDADEDDDDEEEDGAAEEGGAVKKKKKRKPKKKKNKVAGSKPAVGR